VAQDRNVGGAFGYTNAHSTDYAPVCLSSGLLIAGRFHENFLK
jgi:hypothetical protein